MEGSKSEAVFAWYNLDPQLFINDVLNGIDDIVDQAFDFYQQEASLIVSDKEGIDRSQELSNGISSIRNMIQAVLDKRMGMWEKFCLQSCFLVPEGFQLPKDVSSKSLLQDELSDSEPEELDTELASLREKIVEAGRESVDLHSKIQAKEKHSILQRSYDASVAEALYLLEENSMEGLVQGIDCNYLNNVSIYELKKIISIMHPKMKAIKIKRDDTKSSSSGMSYSPSKRQRLAARDQGLPTKLEDLQRVADILKNM